MKQLVLLYKAIHAVDLQILKINCTKKEGKRRCVRRGGGGGGGGGGMHLVHVHPHL